MVPGPVTNGGAHQRYLPQVMEVRRQARVRCAVEEKDGCIQLSLLTQAGHIAAVALLTINPLYYAIAVIKVSRPNIGRGLGRLLQIEAALLALQRATPYKLPAYAFTMEGRSAFNGYPLRPASLLTEKLPVAALRCQPALDRPWEEPSVSLPAGALWPRY